MEKIKNIKLPNGEVYELGGGLDDKITNCLLEVPQRIKYDLTDGTLTLKAGSVVIVPYGKTDRTSEFPVGATFINDNFKVYDTQYLDGKFFVWVELLSDYSHSKSGGNGTYIVTISPKANRLVGTEQTSSGTTIGANNMHYHTDVNKVSVYVNSVIEVEDCALPMYILTRTTTEVTAVQQVFNGFGYIGSTVWVDKGVKGLIPNGRNEDGSLNNIEVVTTEISINYANNEAKYCGINAIGVPYFADITYYYNEKENTNIQNNVFWGVCVIADIDVANGNTTSFNPKQPFKAVDYNELTPTIPDYSAMVQANGTGWIQVAQDSFVMSYAVDAYTEDYWVQVSPNQSTVYNVGRRADDQNQYTQHVSFTFFVPAKWYFRTTADNAYAYIYPLKGAK